MNNVFIIIITITTVFLLFENIVIKLKISQMEERERMVMELANEMLKDLKEKIEQSLDEEELEETGE